MSLLEGSRRTAESVCLDWKRASKSRSNTRLECSKAVRARQYSLICISIMCSVSWAASEWETWLLLVLCSRIVPQYLFSCRRLYETILLSWELLWGLEDITERGEVCLSCLALYKVSIIRLVAIHFHRRNSISIWACWSGLEYHCIG